MSDPNETLYLSLLHWVNKLREQGVHNQKIVQNILDFNDGIVLASLFNFSVSEEYQIQQELQSSEECSDNWASALQNLNTLYDSIQKYSEKYLQSKIEDLEFLPIFSDMNKECMLNLIEIVFRIILQGDKKNHFITAVTKLAYEDQEKLSHLIKRLINQTGDNKLTLNTDFDEEIEERSKQKSNKNNQLIQPKQRQAIEIANQSIEQRNIKIFHNELSSEKDLLKRIDELEHIIVHEQKKHEYYESENNQLRERISYLEEQVFKMEANSDKIEKQKEEFFESVGLSNYDEIQVEMKSKKIRNAELNKIIDELKSTISDKNNQFKEEMKEMQTKLDKFKNYDKMMEMIKTLSDQNKELEKKIKEPEKQIEELKRRNQELSQRFNEKEETMKRKFEQRELLEKNIELEHQLSEKYHEISQLKADLSEQIQLNHKQEELLSLQSIKLREVQLFPQSDKRRPSTPKKNLSSDFNEMVNQLEMHEIYKKSQKHNKSEHLLTKQVDKLNGQQGQNHHLPSIKITTPFNEREKLSMKKIEDQELHETEEFKEQVELLQNDQNEDEIEKQERTTEQTQDQIDDMETDQLQQHLQEYKESNELLEVENSTLKSQIKKLQLENAKKSSVSDSIKQISQLQEDKITLEARLNTIEKAFKKAQEEIKGREEEFQRFSAELKEKADVLNEECKQLKQNERKQIQNENYKKELEKIKKQQERMRIDYLEKKSVLEDEIRMLVSLLSENIMIKHDELNSVGQ